ncbi:unnamed protein product [Ectocarpus sp. 6 AP-2014]
MVLWWRGDVLWRTDRPLGEIMHANEIRVYHRHPNVFWCEGTLNNRNHACWVYGGAISIGVILDSVKTEVAVGVTGAGVEDRRTLSLVEQTDHAVHVDDCRPDQINKSVYHAE